MAMKACAVLSLLLPALAVADTVHILTKSLRGSFLIPQEKFDNIIEGIKKFDAEILALPQTNHLCIGQTIADALSLSADNCYKSTAPDKLRARQEIGFIHKRHVTVAIPGISI